MIITKFNSYLEKHSKKTYFVLCIIIAIIFIIIIITTPIFSNTF